jgi:glycosyltransferase involved in cell wall biosynthesis
MYREMSTSFSNVATDAAEARIAQVQDIAVLVPCCNEASSIADVVTAFGRALPEATVYVYDNNSTDGTASVARAAGAVVRREPRQGKGNVVRRMLADIDADIYVIVDGDDTYDAGSARKMVDLLRAENLDMVVGVRIPVEGEDEVFRRGHTLGNRAFNRTARLLFGSGFTDIFSGYRVMSRRFVKSFPLTSSGFEIETEITVHAVEISASFAEVETPYGTRHAETSSKLHTYSDGIRILRRAISLFKELRPLRFFGLLFALFTIAALGLGVPVVAEYAGTGLVLRFPTAILAAALQILAFIFLTAGIVLDSVSRLRREARVLAYLAIPAARSNHDSGSRPAGSAP